MTISSAKLPAPARAGFTLVEVMVTSAIGSFVMLALLTCFGMIARTGTSLYNYVDMEEQARRGLERFSEDTRMASAVDSTLTASPSSPAQAPTYPDGYSSITMAWPNVVKLTIPHVASDSYSNTVYYWWDNSTGSPYYHNFRRQEVDTNSSGAAQAPVTTELIRNVQTFQFDRWQAGGATGMQATSDANTDQLQIHLTLRKQGSERGSASTAIVAATNLVVSARYILRNKH